MLPNERVCFPKLLLADQALYIDVSVDGDRIMHHVFYLNYNHFKTET